MNWRDLGKRSVPVDLPMQFVALLIALAWITHGHMLAMQSVISMAPPLALPSIGIGDAMAALAQFTNADSGLRVTKLNIRTPVFLQASLFVSTPLPRI